MKFTIPFLIISMFFCNIARGDDAVSNPALTRIKIPLSQGQLISALSFTGNNNIATLTSSGKVYFINISTREIERIEKIDIDSGVCLRLLSTSDDVFAVISSGLTESWGKIVRITKKNRDQQNSVVFERKKPFSDAVISSSGTVIAISQYDELETILLVSTVDWNIDRAIRFSDAPSAVTMDDSGKLVASCSSNTLGVWDVKTGQQKWQIKDGRPKDGRPMVELTDQPSFQDIKIFALNHELQCFVVKSDIWRGAHGELYKLENQVATRKFDLVEGEPCATILSGPLFLLSGGGYGSLRKESDSVSLRLWSLETGAKLKTFAVPDDAGSIVVLTAEPQRQLFAAGTSKGEVLIWQIKDLQESTRQ